MQVSVSMRENSLGQRMAEEPVSWEMSYLVDLPYMAFLVGVSLPMSLNLTAVPLAITLPGSEGEEGLGF